MRTYIVVFFVLTSNLLFAADFTLKSSCTSGSPCNWDQASSWVGGVVPENNAPSDDDRIIIPENTFVNIRGGGNKITINNRVDILIYGTVTFSENSAKLDLTDPGSTIQVATTGDIITDATGQSETISIGSGSIKGDNIDALLSPNQVTEDTLNDPSNGGCAETGTCDADPLPVQLLFFQGRLDHQEVHLSWATSTEENFDYFEISRSLDGLYFEVIGTVNGAGTTTIRQDYEFIDTSPYQGLNYFRLRSIDFDGYTETFDLVAIQANRNLMPSVYPNPTNGRSLKIAGLDNENPYGLKIFGLDGRAYFDAQDQKDNQIEISPALSMGIYVLEIAVGDQKFTQRLLVK